MSTSGGPASVDEVVGLADQLQAGQGTDNAQLLQSLDELTVADRAQDIHLKRLYAIWILVILSAQILIANVLMFLYAALGKHWKVPDDVMQVWFSATVVQLVSIVAVVTRYLFPRRDST